MIHANKAEGEQITKGGRVGSAKRSVCAFTLSLSASVKISEVQEDDPSVHMRQNEDISACWMQWCRTETVYGSKDELYISLYFYTSLLCFTFMHYCRLFWIGKYCTSKISSCLNGCNFNSLNNVGISWKYISVGNVARSHLLTPTLDHEDKVHNSNVQYLL